MSVNLLYSVWHINSGGWWGFWLCCKWVNVSQCKYFRQIKKKNFAKDVSIYYLWMTVNKLQMAYFCCTLYLCQKIFFGKSGRLNDSLVLCSSQHGLVTDRSHVKMETQAKMLPRSGVWSLCCQQGQPWQEIVSSVSLKLKMSARQCK